MSLDGDEKLFEAHSTQHNFPIHSGLLPSSRTGPPLVLVLTMSQKELPSITSGEFETKHIVLVVAFQMDDVNVHRLEFEILTAQA